MTSGMTETLTVRKALPSDLDAVKLIADAHRHELGFVLRPALARSIAREELLVAENRAGVIGFVEYHHRQDEQTTLYHIVVASDHRWQGVGRALVNALSEEARVLEKQTIRLKCPADLPAQGFYARMGFNRVGEEAGNKRTLVIWAFPLASIGTA